MANHMEVWRWPVGLAAPAKPLVRQRWIFWFHAEALTLYLDAYYEEARPTAHRKWRAERGYERLQAHAGRFRGIKLPDVPFPPDVTQEAITRFRSQIAIKKWDRK